MGKEHLEELGQNRDALFLSDPTNSGLIVVGTITKLNTFLKDNPEKIGQFTTTHELLKTLDWETLDEDEQSGYDLIVLD